jgi:hypothetical protein
VTLENAGSLVEKLTEDVDFLIRSVTGDNDAEVKLIELFKDIKRGFGLVWTDFYKITGNGGKALVPEYLSQNIRTKFIANLTKITIDLSASEIIEAETPVLEVIRQALK